MCNLKAPELRGQSPMQLLREVNLFDNRHYRE
jgi:hypothetical protein